jgi:hypothetical protein
MTPVFWTRDLSFNWLAGGGTGVGQQRIIFYVYGGIVNRANAWMSPSFADAEAAAATNSSTFHVAMSFESPDPIISRAFLTAASLAAGAFHLFISCTRDVMDALAPQHVMFMSCGWAEGSPEVEEWEFSAQQKTRLVSLQVREATPACHRWTREFFFTAGVDFEFHGGS